MDADYPKIFFVCCEFVIGPGWNLVDRYYCAHKHYVSDLHSAVVVRLNIVSQEAAREAISTIPWHKAETDNGPWI